MSKLVIGGLVGLWVVEPSCGGRTRRYEEIKSKEYTIQDSRVSTREALLKMAQIANLNTVGANRILIKQHIEIGDENA